MEEAMLEAPTVETAAKLSEAKVRSWREILPADSAVQDVESFLTDPDVPSPSQDRVNRYLLGNRVNEPRVQAYRLAHMQILLEVLINAGRLRRSDQSGGEERYIVQEL